MAHVDPVPSKVILEVDLANLIKPSAKIAREPALVELVKLMLRGLSFLPAESFVKECWPLRGGKCHSGIPDFISSAPERKGAHGRYSPIRHDFS